MGFHRGRPRKHESIRITSFYIPISHESLIQELNKLGLQERKTQNDMVLIAIKEYVEAHSPGNPQPPLSTWTLQVPTALTLQARLAAKDLTQILDKLEGLKDPEGRAWLVEKLGGFMLQLAKVNDRLPGHPYEQLVKKAQNVLGIGDERDE